MQKEDKDISNTWSKPEGYLESLKHKLDTQLKGIDAFAVPDGYLSKAQAQISKRIEDDKGGKMAWKVMLAAACAVLIAGLFWWNNTPANLTDQWAYETIDITDETLEWTDWDDIADLKINALDMNLVSEEELETYFLNEEWEWSELDELIIEL